MTWLYGLPVAVLALIVAGYAFYRLARRTGVRDAADAINQQTDAQLAELEKKVAAARRAIRQHRDDWL